MTVAFGETDDRHMVPADRDEPTAATAAQDPSYGLSGRGARPRKIARAGWAHGVATVGRVDVPWPEEPEEQRATGSPTDRRGAPRSCNRGRASGKRIDDDAGPLVDWLGADR